VVRSPGTTAPEAAVAEAVVVSVDAGVDGTAPADVGGCVVDGCVVGELGGGVVGGGVGDTASPTTKSSPATGASDPAGTVNGGGEVSTPSYPAGGWTLGVHVPGPTSGKP
jgi:hypothetical protein